MPIGTAPIPARSDTGRFFVADCSVGNRPIPRRGALDRHFLPQAATTSAMRIAGSRHSGVLK